MKAVKFEFTRAFDEEAKLAQAEADAREHQEFEAAKQMARDDGYAAGQAAALNDISARIQAAGEAMGAEIARLIKNRADIERRLEERAVKLSYEIAAKLAGQLMAAHPRGGIEALIADCLESCRMESRLVVRVAPDLAEPIQAEVTKIKAHAGFAGEVIVLGDPDLGHVTCRVEWADGGAEISPQDTSEAIEGLIQNYLAASDSMATLDSQDADSRGADSGAQAEKE